ncbi:MAG: hypothetical protein H8E10_09145 [Desulfobacterales bacterium]|nr:hypothetical protein [Desulfobacterales bacterium]MBL7205878.1 hypothetical protein [Desulfobacteraceae bacterium]
METKKAQDWAAFDVIKGLFAFLNKDTISSASPVIHSALYNLTKKDKYKKFLKEYVFDHRSYFPFSRDLHTDLLNLQQSGHLSAQNPDFIEYTVNSKLKTTFELYTKNLFSEQEIAILKELAKDFTSEMADA